MNAFIHSIIMVTTRASTIIVIIIKCLILKLQPPTNDEHAKLSMVILLTNGTLLNLNVILLLKMDNMN